MFKYKVIIQALVGNEIKVFKYYDQPLSEVMRFLQLKSFEGFEIVSMTISFIKPESEAELTEEEKKQYALNLQNM